MKVILVNDIKNKGKKGEILDLAPGYANYLIKQKLAVPADQANVKKLAHEKRKLEEAEAIAIREAEEVKSIIDNVQLIFKVKVGEDDKIFGSISTKQIVDALEKEYGQSIDKRKILLNDNIKTLGVTPVVVQLHPKVKTEFSVLVTNK